MKKVKFSEFYNYDEMVDFLREAEREYKPMLNLRVLTETPEGRNILLAEITDPSTGTAPEKGAYYIQDRKSVV